jgi:hypothetical protein
MYAYVKKLIAAPAQPPPLAKKLKLAMLQGVRVC